MARTRETPPHPLKLNQEVSGGFSLIRKGEKSGLIREGFLVHAGGRLNVEKITLKIGRLNTQPEFWWYCERNGLPTPYVLPVEQFRDPMSVLCELKKVDERWRLHSINHPARRAMLKAAQAK